MKKLIVFILFFFTLRAYAPELNCFYIFQIVVNYDPLIKAVNIVEVGDGNDLYNEVENAVGWFQIRQIRVEDYNKRRGTNYKLEDFYDYELSKEMFLYYAKGKTFEQAAKDWNGSGPKTIDYWNLVKARL